MKLGQTANVPSAHFFLCRRIRSLAISVARQPHDLSCDQRVWDAAQQAGMRIRLSKCIACCVLNPGFSLVMLSGVFTPVISSSGGISNIYGYTCPQIISSSSSSASSKSKSSVPLALYSFLIDKPYCSLTA